MNPPILHRWRQEETLWPLYGVYCLLPGGARLS